MKKNLFVTFLLIIACAVITPAGSGASQPPETQPPGGSGSLIDYEVIPPGHDWILSWSAPDAERLFALTISNRAVPLTGLKPVQFGLRRSDGDSSIDFGRLHMLTSPGGAPVEKVGVKANEAKTIFLRLDSGSAAGPYGTFAGNVHFAAEGSPVKAVAIIAKASSSGVRLAGAILVLVGLCFAVVLTTYLQPRLLRLQALRPASVLRETLLRFASGARLAAADDLAGIENEAKQQAARLEERALDAEGLLPPRISITNAGATDSTSKLKLLLDEISARLAGLIVLRDTVMQLRARGGTGAARPKPIADAIVQINQATAEAATVDAARAIVARVTEPLRTAGFADAAPGLRAPAPSVEQVDFALQHAAGIAWAIWGLASLAIGVTYGYSDVDVGTATDLLGAFLWGFGLTAFGAGVQNLTPSSIATHVGLKVPRGGGTPES